MEGQGVQTKIIKRLKSLSQESLQQVQLFVHFIQMREKMKHGMDDLGHDLAMLDERERIHLEGEFETTGNDTPMKDNYVSDTRAVVLRLEKRKIPVQVKEVFVRAEAGDV